MFGNEVDGLDHVARSGLTYPTGRGGASEDIVIPGIGLGTNSEADHGAWAETLCIGDSGTAWKAQSPYGGLTPQTLERSVHGNGMIVGWQRGGTAAFTAATCEWVKGLKRGDMQVGRITRNVLSRFGERALAALTNGGRTSRPAPGSFARAPSRADRLARCCAVPLLTI